MWEHCPFCRTTHQASSKSFLKGLHSKSPILLPKRIAFLPTILFLHGIADPICNPFCNPHYYLHWWIRCVCVGGGDNGPCPIPKARPEMCHPPYSVNHGSHPSHPPIAGLSNSTDQKFGPQPPSAPPANIHIWPIRQKIIIYVIPQVSSYILDHSACPVHLYKVTAGAQASVATF